MVRRRGMWAIIVAGSFAGVVAMASAQPERKAATLDDLLAELKGLRADLGQTSQTSMRMQLLTARLSLQEQRITFLANQRADISTRLATATRDRVEIETRVKSFQEALPTATPQMREELEGALKHETIALSQRREVEQQLRAQETELTGMIESEQGRWQDFNGRLDELERSLSSKAPR